MILQFIHVRSFACRKVGCETWELIVLFVLYCVTMTINLQTFTSSYCSRRFSACDQGSHCVFFAPRSNGVTRLDGAQGEKQLWRSHVRTWGLSEANVLYWRACDIVGTFWGAPPVIRRPHSDSAPGALCPPCPPSLRPCPDLLFRWLGCLGSIMQNRVKSAFWSAKFISNFNVFNNNRKIALYYNVCMRTSGEKVSISYETECAQSVSHLYVSSFPGLYT